ncbi:tetratricopeptide repeat protein [Streptomyces sp. NPDC093510]|uniref:tetratricopeptide repeat protein n=1 Tax=Streptomyces sp. NPDC093510 TaxID=3155199 RepID=UPI00341AA965
MTIAPPFGSAPHRPGEDPADWPVAGAWEPLAAGVHPSLPDAGNHRVPPYVARDVDERIRGCVEETARRGGLVVLVGDSAAGKTRALFEAVRTVLPNHRVCAPPPDEDMSYAVTSVENHDGPCVVWLDDLERFLRPGGLGAGLLAALERRRVPVVATMRLKPFEAFGAERDRGPWTHLLRAAQVVDLHRLWSERELARAGQYEDARVLEAVAHHGPYGVAEYLAAGPALLLEWRRAGAGNGHARGAALVRVAVDLTRSGLQGPYSQGQLEELHERCLTADGVLRPEPLEAAFAWASEVRHGVTSLLVPARDGRWAAFDYLVDHTDAPLPEWLWHAALAHSATEADRLIVARNARSAAPRVAEQAWRQLADRGNPYAAYDLAQLLTAAEHVQEAESRYRQALGKGHPDAANDLAILLEDQGRLDEAEALYRRALATGDPYAAGNLGELLVGAGRHAEALALYRRMFTGGFRQVAQPLAALLRKMGRHSEAEPFYRVAVELGHPGAVEDFVSMLMWLGRGGEAEALRREYVRE